MITVISFGLVMYMLFTKIYTNKYNIQIFTIINNYSTIFTINYKEVPVLLIRVDARAGRPSSCQTAPLGTLRCSAALKYQGRERPEAVPGGPPVLTFKYCDCLRVDL